MTQIAAVDHGELHERWVASTPTASAKTGVGLSSKSPTLPVFMWSQMRFPDRLPMVLALATVILCVTCAAIVAVFALRGRDTMREQAA
jgi:hypothetical protein